MESLEQLIVRESNFTHGELRQAMFAHPNVGIIEAVRRAMGNDKSKELIDLVSRSLAIPQLDAAGLTVDEHIIGEGGEELQRLIYAFRAVPLNWYGKEEKKKLRLAMVDPADRYARDVFSSYFGTQVMPCTAPEVEMFEALADALAACPPDADFRNKVSQYALEFPTREEPEEITKALTLMISQAISNNAKDIELEFRDTFTKALIGLPLDMIKPIDLPVLPEDLVSALVARSDLQKTQRAVFEGTCHMRIKDAVVDAHIEFHEFHKNRSGVEGKSLILSNFEINSRSRSSLWFSAPTEGVQALDKALSASAGLFVLGFPDEELRQAAIATLQRRYPDVFLVPDLQSLAKDASLPSRVKHSRVLVTIPATGLTAVLKQLDPVPSNVRSLMRIVFAYSRLPRICYYCAEDCVPTDSSMELFPETYREHVKLLKYPRGCAVCEKEGYSGTLGLCSFLSMETDAGKAFLQGKQSAELLPLLRGSGFRSIVETGLDMVLAGATTIEMFSESLLKNKNIPAQHFKTIGKQIVRDGKVMATGSEKKDKSPLDGSKPTKGNMADFHSVVLELDDDFMSMRNQLMDEEGEESDELDESW